MFLFFSITKVNDTKIRENFFCIFLIFLPSKKTINGGVYFYLYKICSLFVFWVLLILLLPFAAALLCCCCCRKMCAYYVVDLLIYICLVGWVWPVVAVATCRINATKWVCHNLTQEITIATTCNTKYWQHFNFHCQC